MFHKVDPDGNIVQYEIFHTKLTHVATIRFYTEDADVTCELVDVDGKFLTYLTGITRNDEGELLNIWKHGFNDAAEEVRKKLKLRMAA